MLDIDKIVDGILDRLEPDDITQYKVIPSRPETIGNNLVWSFGTGEIHDLFHAIVEAQYSNFNKYFDSEKACVNALYNWFMAILAIGRVIDFWLKDDRVIKDQVFTNLLYPGILNYSVMIKDDESNTGFSFIKLSLVPNCASLDWRNQLIALDTENGLKAINLKDLKKDPVEFYNEVVEK